MSHSEVNTLDSSMNFCTVSADNQISYNQKSFMTHKPTERICTQNPLLSPQCSIPAAMEFTKENKTKQKTIS